MLELELAIGLGPVHAQTVLELAMSFWSMLAVTSGPVGAHNGDMLAQGRKEGRKGREGKEERKQDRSEGKHELHL